MAWGLNRSMGRSPVVLCTLTEVPGCGFSADSEASGDLSNGEPFIGQPMEVEDDAFVHHGLLPGHF